MDPRADFNKNLLQGFSDYINVIINRKPLPMPSGIVNSDGTIVPGSAKDAEQEVIKLNLMAEEQFKQAVKLFGGEKPPVKEPEPVSIEPPSFTGDFLPGNRVNEPSIKLTEWQILPLTITSQQSALKWPATSILWAGRSSHVCRRRWRTWLLIRLMLPSVDSRHPRR